MKRITLLLLAMVLAVGLMTVPAMAGGSCPNCNFSMMNPSLGNIGGYSQSGSGVSVYATTVGSGGVTADAENTTTAYGNIKGTATPCNVTLSMYLNTETESTASESINPGPINNFGTGTVAMAGADGFAQITFGNLNNFAE
jgi:hypothetical protein